jgi:hypothetical protein
MDAAFAEDMKRSCRGHVISRTQVRKLFALIKLSWQGFEFFLAELSLMILLTENDPSMEE